MFFHVISSANKIKQSIMTVDNPCLLNLHCLMRLEPFLRARPDLFITCGPAIRVFSSLFVLSPREKALRCHTHRGYSCAWTLIPERLRE
jgi:hypothetical protein